MKSIIVLFVLVLFSISIHAQRIDLDEKLRAKFSKAEVNDLRQYRPAQYEYWAYYAENRCELIQIPVEKLHGDYEEIQFNLKTMNFLSLDLGKAKVSGQTYRIVGTTTLLLVKPEHQFLNEFNSRNN